MTRARLALVLLCCFPAAASAAGDAPVKIEGVVQDADALQALAGGAPACKTFSNACSICQRADTGVLTCSTPAIACTATAWTCADAAQPK